jgi:hypothetical protein
MVIIVAGWTALSKQARMSVGGARPLGLVAIDLWSLASTISPRNCLRAEKDYGEGHCLVWSKLTSSSMITRQYQTLKPTLTGRLRFLSTKELGEFLLKEYRQNLRRFL